MVTAFAVAGVAPDFQPALAPIAVLLDPVVLPPKARAPLAVL